MCETNVIAALICSYLEKNLGFPGDSDGKESVCNVRRPRFASLGQEDPLEKRRATRSSILV